jgi:hypothetical protein
MSWPHDTLAKLRDAGYSYQEQGKCLSPNCRVTVFWFITPNRKWMPFEMIAPTDHESATTRYQPHFASCPDARKFSRKSKTEVQART